MIKSNFINEACAVDPTKVISRNAYGFNRAPCLLFLWGRLFQKVVSQSGTYLLTKKFHNRHAAIYKAEGGVNIVEVGDLVLKNRGCYFDDDFKAADTQAKKIAALITHIVLEWNPVDPIESMLGAAAEYIGVDPESLRGSIKESVAESVFGGNALADFFDWNPFAKPPINRPYQKFCLVTFQKWAEEEVDQLWADEDLGEELLKLINEKLKSESAYDRALCCDPRRDESGLRFWVNTGRSTQIDGWKTEKELRDFINSDESLKNSNNES